MRLQFMVVLGWGSEQLGSYFYPFFAYYGLYFEFVVMQDGLCVLLCGTVICKYQLLQWLYYVFVGIWSCLFRLLEHHFELSLSPNLSLTQNRKTKFLLFSNRHSPKLANWQISSIPPVPIPCFPCSLPLLSSLYVIISGW